MANDLLDKFGNNYPENSVIFREGDGGDDMFIIQSGEVTISKKSQKNTQHILAVLRNGDFFGEMSLFTTENRSATAMTSKKSVILRIDKTAFDFMLSNNQPFAKKMITKLCERLKKADEQIAELIAISPDIKMLEHLISYWKIAGQKDKNQELLLLPYADFLEYLKNRADMQIDEIKTCMMHLKENSIVHLKKDTQGKIYVSFSPQVFKYFNIM